ncbi:hypothetical protein X975_02456, partial [Stegodyphus mimosarum]
MLNSNNGPKQALRKDLFKLLNNAVFRIMIENLRKRTQIDVVRDEKKAENTCGFIKFPCIPSNSRTSSCRMEKKSLVLNCPLYGFFILRQLPPSQYSVQ